MRDGAKAASLFALGCGAQERLAVDAGGLRDAQTGDGAPAPYPDSSVAPEGGPYDGGPYSDASGGDGALVDGDAGECLATRADIEGPFFKPSSPQRTMIAEAGVAGMRITVRGQIVDASCRPIEGAIVDFWQADDEGAYDDVGFLFRGHQVVGADGRYEVSTIIPGRYLNGSQYRPAHVHCKVIVAGRELLTTQLYFEGDPFNDVDPWFSELTMLRPKETDDGLLADFDFSVNG